MRKVIILTAILSLTCARAYAVLDAEEPWLPGKGDNAPEVSLSTAFMTKYIWRGWNLGDEPVMQTDASISWYGFTFDFWTNYTLNNDKEKDDGRYQEFTEADYTFDYTFNVGDISEKLNMDSPDLLDPLSVSGGYIYYTFPNVDWKDKFFDTHEVYLGASYDTLLQPYFMWYWDVGVGKGDPDGGGDGSYFQAGISHTFDFEQSGVSATLGMSAGYIDEQWTSESGWADMVFSGEVSVPFLNYFTVTPSVAYSLILDKDTYKDGAENEFYGGVKIGFDY